MGKPTVQILTRRKEKKGEREKVRECQKRLMQWIIAKGWFQFQASAPGTTQVHPRYTSGRPRHASGTPQAHLRHSLPTNALAQSRHTGRSGGGRGGGWLFTALARHVRRNVT